MTDQTQPRETVEILRLIEIAEASKMRIERWLAPMVAISAAIGTGIASWSAVSALLHIAGK
jgi:hypothetical protein